MQAFLSVTFQDAETSFSATICREACHQNLNSPASVLQKQQDYTKNRLHSAAINTLELDMHDIFNFITSEFNLNFSKCLSSLVSPYFAVVFHYYSFENKKY